MRYLNIQGMTCQDCADHIQATLEDIAGVHRAEVSHTQAFAAIHAHSHVRYDALIQAIHALGYVAEKALHVAIIGSGSAAFACAIKAAENGARVSLVESAQVMGGCCVNVGCVPSKILIQAAQLAQQQRDNPFAGIKNHEPQINRVLLAQQQAARVEALRFAKYQHILESNPALSLIKGRATFQDKHSLLIEKKDGEKQRLLADRFLIATGSKAIIPAIEGLADTPYWTSTELLFTEQAPAHLIIIGSSVVAVELAQACCRLGSKVTLLARHHLLFHDDPLLGKGLTEALQNEGVKVLQQTQARQIAYENEQFTVRTNNGNIIGDRLLIASGRQPDTQALNLHAVAVKTRNNGAIRVNRRMQTSAEHIYAAGDCSDMPQLVYVAAAAGSRAGINMTGGHAELDLSVLPTVIFTDPQVARVGLTEQQAQAQNIATDSRVLGMENVPRALVNFATDGFIKLVTEAQTGRLIGAQILAHEAGELIQSAALAIRNHMTVDELAQQFFPYLVSGRKLAIFEGL
ncbi:MAG: mercury(II) reductase [gamma proteobacterium symbiont of Bathyaustriella thionipta]|nr:mercury(II) reductase [gamma proteobacterium symbiont of Bathyaustriella thionipta]